MAGGLGTVIINHASGTNEASVIIPVLGIANTAKIDTFGQFFDDTPDHNYNDHQYYGVLADRSAEVNYSAANTYVVVPNSRTSKTRSTQPQGRLTLNRNNPLSKKLGLVLCGNNIYIDNTYGGNFNFSDVPSSSRTPSGPLKLGIGNLTLNSRSNCAVTTTGTYTLFAQFYISIAGVGGSGDDIRLNTTSSYSVRIAHTSDTLWIYSDAGWTTFSLVSNTLYTIVLVCSPTLTSVYSNGTLLSSWGASNLGLVLTTIETYNNWYPNNLTASIVGLYYRELSLGEIKALSANPYQMFEESSTRILPVAQTAGIPNGIKITSTSEHKLNGNFKWRYVWVN